MPNRTAASPHKTATILLLLAGIATATLRASGQGSATPTPTATTATHPLTFDVVSIRRNNSNERPHIGATPDGYEAIHVPLIGLFQIAYVPTAASESAFFSNNRIVGAPGWLNGGEIYDVRAKVAESDLAEWAKPSAQPAMLRAMLQSLLADRCKAVVHRETKVVPVYHLVLAKGGPKFKPAETLDPAELRQKHPAGNLIPGGGWVAPGPDRQINFFAASPVSLAQLLSNLAGRPVQDNTGLTGRYDFTLQIGPPAPPPAAGPDASPAPDPGPSIFTALQEQLGLRLDPAQSEVETLVIDHVDHPSEN